MARPLWELLLLARESKETLALTCEECIALLEYDADRLAAGANPAEIHPSVSRHLALCSSCTSQLEDWLDNLEESLVHDYREQSPSDK
jgi:hypothetical protein